MLANVLHMLTTSAPLTHWSTQLVLHVLTTTVCTQGPQHPLLKAVFTHTTASERVTIEYGDSVGQFEEDNAHAAVWLGECGACLLSVSCVYWKIDTASFVIIPVYTHTHTLILTLHYTCCYDEIKRNSKFQALFLSS